MRALALLLCCGCATTLSTMDTARTTDPGHVRVNAAMGVYVPAGTALRLVSDGTDLAKRLIAESRDPTVEELDKMFEAGLAVAVLPIAPVQELQIRTGIVRNLDAGLRLATTGARLDLKFRFWNGGDQHASIGAGASKYFFSGPVFDALSFVKIDDFSRWDFEVPLLFSSEAGETFRFYGGAKYVLSLFSMDEKLVKAQHVAEQNGSPDVFRAKEKMHFVGGVAGIMLGFRHVFVALELTAGYTVAEPEIYSFVSKRPEKRSLGGVTLYPALGLVLAL